MTESFIRARRAQALEAALKIAEPGTHSWELIQFAQQIEGYLYPEEKAPEEKVPERRIFYIDVGSMPPAKAKEHIESIDNPLFNALFEKMYPHQEMILNALYKNKDLLVLSSSDNGISTIISQYVREQLTKNPGVYIRIISSPDGKKDYERFFRWSLSEGVKLDNGSIIEIDTFAAYRESSAKEKPNTDILIIDEVELLPYAYEENVMSVINEMKESGGKVFIFGRAGGRLFKSLWDDINSNKLIFPWFVHPDREEAWGKNTRKQVGEKAFARDYECKWPPVVD